MRARQGDDGDRWRREQSERRTPGACAAAYVQSGAVFKLMQPGSQREEELDYQSHGEYLAAMGVA